MLPSLGFAGPTRCGTVRWLRKDQEVSPRGFGEPMSECVGVNSGRDLVDGRSGPEISEHWADPDLVSPECIDSPRKRVRVDRHDGREPAAGAGTIRRGAGLDRSRDVAIRGAVLKVLAEDGYPGLTMDAVAMAAGVGRATIYRRWASKEDLLVSAIEDTSVDTLAVPDTGTVRDDLVHLLRSLADVLAGPGGDANRALLGVLPNEPALAEAYRRGPLVVWEQAFLAIFRRAADRGELSAGAGSSLAAEAGPAILIER